MISQFDYRYDNTANRIGVTEASGDRVTWTYDAGNQLTRERRSGVNGYDVTHVYDPAGNRTLKLDGGSRTTSVYNGANQIVWSQDGSGRTTITYDADGNLTREVKPSGQITTSVWDAENMNSAVLLPDTTRVTYTYNADHLRVRKDTASGTRKYVFDLQNPFTETDGSDVTQAVYVVEPQTYGNIVSQRQLVGGIWNSVYYHFDALGSTGSLSDGMAVVTDTYTYTAFGETKASTGTTTNVYTWVGELGYFRDVETGSYNLHERPYEPERARMKNPDPLGLEVDPNEYRIVGNNPVNAVDPSGMQEIPPEAQIIELQSRVDSELRRTGQFWDSPVGISEADRARFKQLYHAFQNDPFGRSENGDTNLDALDLWLDVHQPDFDRMLAWRNEGDKEDRRRRDFDQLQRQRLDRILSNLNEQRKFNAALARLRARRFEELSKGNPALADLQTLLDTNDICYGPPPAPPSIGGTAPGETVIGEITRSRSALAFDALFKLAFPDLPSDPSTLLELLYDQRQQTQEDLDILEDRAIARQNENDRTDRARQRNQIVSEVKTRIKERRADALDLAIEQKVERIQTIDSAAGVIANIIKSGAELITNVNSLRLRKQQYAGCTFVWIEANQFNPSTGDSADEFTGPRTWVKVSEETARRYLNIWYEYKLPPFKGCKCSTPNGKPPERCP